jgi:hypothetical protein
MMSLALYAIVFGMFPYRSEAFGKSLLPRNHLHSSLTVLHLAKIDTEAASAKLTWEVLEERMARPVLDLSTNHEDLLENGKPSLAVETSEWDQGQMWSETRKGLLALGISSPDEFLIKCPQLYRLESSQVLKTSKWLIEQEGFGVAYVLREPRVLSYTLADVQYGLEFLQLVPLLPSGIEGGLQERAVKEALGSAAEATSNANQRIAGDIVATTKALKQKGPGFL